MTRHMFRRIGKVLGVLTVAAVGAVGTTVVVSPSAAQATNVDFEYTLNPVHNSGKCLDIQGGSTANGARLVQYACHGGANQRFRFVRITGSFYNIRPVHVSGKCLEVAGASTADRARIVQFACDNGTQQMFRLLDDSAPDVAGFSSRIRAHPSGKCLDVEGGSSANSAPVVQFTCTGGSNQRFFGLGLAK